jgi:ribosomal protein S18 acetylase RimI-like enzyme
VDLPALLDLEERTLPAEHRAAPPALRLLIRTAHVVVLEDAVAILGMGIAESRTGTWYLAVIAVDPAHQRRGLGRRLAEHLIQQAPASRHLATAIAVTEDGRAFLERLGFAGEGEVFQKPIGRRA